MNEFVICPCEIAQQLYEMCFEGGRIIPITINDNQCAIPTSVMSDSRYAVARDILQRYEIRQLNEIEG